MADVIVNDSFSGEIEIDCLIIGGGAAGLTAALAATEDGASTLVAERENQLSVLQPYLPGLYQLLKQRPKRDNL